MADSLYDVLDPDQIKKPSWMPKSAQQDTPGLAPKINTGAAPPNLSPFGSPMPKSVLGTDVPPGQQISEEQMPKAEKLAANPKAEAQFLGKQQFNNQLQQFGDQKKALDHMMPTDVTDPAFLPKLNDYRAERGALKEKEATFKKEHPWGSPESEHPGVFGKIGHVLGEIGNVAGATLAPNLTAAIPGSQLNLSAQQHAGANEIKEAETEQAMQQKATAAQDTANAHLQDSGTKAIVDPEKAAALTKKAETGQQAENLREQTLPAQLGADIAGGGNVNDPNAQRIIPAIQATQKPGAEKTPPHITTLQPDGKTHIMERDPATGEYSIDRGVAPPNYAQAAAGLHTATIIDPQSGLPTVVTLTGRKIGTSATGGYGHEMAQAGAVERAGGNLVNELYNPQNRELLGKLSSYITQGTLGTPLADAQAAKLSSELKTFAALQPALHGFRARTAQEAFEKIIGGLAQSPDATIGAIEGILNTAEAVNPGLQHSAPSNQSNGQIGSDADFQHWQSQRKPK